MRVNLIDYPCIINGMKDAGLIQHNRLVGHFTEISKWLQDEIPETSVFIEPGDKLMWVDLEFSNPESYTMFLMRWT